MGRYTHIYLLLACGLFDITSSSSSSKRGEERFTSLVPSNPNNLAAKEDISINKEILNYIINILRLIGLSANYKEINIKINNIVNEKNKETKNKEKFTKILKLYQSIDKPIMDEEDDFAIEDEEVNITMEEHAKFLEKYEYTEIKNSNLIYKYIDKDSLEKKNAKLLFVQKAFQDYQKEKTLSKLRSCILELDHYVNDPDSFKIVVVRHDQKEELTDCGDKDQLLEMLRTLKRLFDSKYEEIDKRILSKKLIRILGNYFDTNHETDQKIDTQRKSKKEELFDAIRSILIEYFPINPENGELNGENTILYETRTILYSLIEDKSMLDKIKRFFRNVAKTLRSFKS